MSSTSRRGPKAKKEQAVVEAPSTPPAAAAASPKKSKKPVKVVAVVTSQGIEGSFAPEPRRPLIAHLQIHSNEVKFHDAPIAYDPNPPTQPEPYDAGADNFFSSMHEFIEEKKEEGGVQATTVAVKKEEQKAVVSNEPLPMFMKADLMVEYREASAAKKLPASTTVGCFWCTFTFEHQPCIIPEREEKGVYRVYGNFCCPECALSYLLHEPMDPHVRWERVALLHRIYDPEGKERIFPAPARETLKLFGGPMTIEQYRATVRSHKVRVDRHMPPMVSILGSIDTKPIDFFDSSLKNTLLHNIDVTTGTDTLKKPGDEELRLKRSKPLKDRGSTLDSVMTIQIKAKR